MFIRRVGRPDDDRRHGAVHARCRRNGVHPVWTWPVFLEVQKVALGRTQFRGLLWDVKMRLATIPKKKRPKVVVFLARALVRGRPQTW